ncbi:cation diffusion facilitator family transporter [Pseudokineococcus sp. 1T1Z-3]|uniref:cation diffusion facilitator family transporter n=1 Tax=Pseudokineococcus sp. 1T1Z-3 TaxID=3132745 RepID=UPI00309D611E
MGHGHRHGGGHGGAGEALGQRRRVLVALLLVLGIVVAQAVGAAVTGSLALLVDVVHSLTDSIGLVVALVAATLVLRPADGRRTWGFRRIEVLAALAQGVLLVAVAVYAVVEAVGRIAEPPEVASRELLLFGVVALALNLAAVGALMGGRTANLNLRAAFLEVLLDALGTLAVIASAVVMMTTGFARADTLAALAIAALVVPRAWLLLRDTLGVLMEFTPRGLDLDDVRAHLLGLEHVRDVHDLHASTVATGLPIITGHVVLDDECFRDGHAPDVLEDVRRCVAEHFDIALEHATFQLETRAHRERESHAASHH